VTNTLALLHKPFKAPTNICITLCIIHLYPAPFRLSTFLDGRIVRERHFNAVGAIQSKTCRLAHRSIAVVEEPLLIQGFDLIEHRGHAGGESGHSLVVDSFVSGAASREGFHDRHGLAPLLGRPPVAASIASQKGAEAWRQRGELGAGDHPGALAIGDTPSEGEALVPARRGAP